MIINENNFAHIKGWGVDADPDNDPTYPIRLRSDNELRGYSWERPTQQRGNIEILHSNERPNLSAVFGTSSPPTGLSGQIRRFAFKYSENEYLHWLPLLLADRIQVVEGIVEDISNGHFPNIFKETGGMATLKYNKKKVAKKVLFVGAIGVVAWLLIDRKAKNKLNRLYK